MTRAQREKTESVKVPKKQVKRSSVVPYGELQAPRV